MKFTILSSASILALCAAAAQAEHFNRIASFPVVSNMAEGDDISRETSSEIIAATADGMTLVYTDSPLGVIGMVDISTPTEPKPLGNLEVGGEPTSVGIIGQTAFVGVNTSESYIQPSGALKAYDVAGQSEVNSCVLGGQPDSVAVARDGTLIAVAIENERDEDLNDGVIPQMPAGQVVLFSVADGMVDCESAVNVDLTGLAHVAPSDPEPEFVSINSLGETVVTMQENNHLAVIAKDGSILSHFSAGAVDLNGIDATDEQAALIFDEAQAGRRREPDAVKWIDDDHFAIANEGDYEGGSRGWSIFSKDGSLVYDSGTSFEHAVVQIGHYPDSRSDAKGIEPESVEFGVFGGTPYVFVGAERASVAGVYDVT